MSDMYSTFLFAQPSAIEGVAQILDFGNTLFVFNSSQTAEEADEIALSLDFQAVGADMRRVVGEMACGQSEER